MLLSGGKDSRLCLALATAAGLGDEILSVTRGAPGTPEVEVATEVARVAGVHHEVLAPGGGVTHADARAGAIDPDIVRRRLRQHSYRYEGIVSPWDGANDRLTRVTVTVDGFGGELYKRGTSKAFHGRELTSVGEVAKLLQHGMDPLRVLTPSVARYQRDWSKKWAEQTAASVRLDALPEKWYVDYRLLGHWDGPLSQGKAGRTAISPLISPRAMQGILELSAAARSNDRFHFEVMSRAAPPSRAGSVPRRHLVPQGRGKRSSAPAHRLLPPRAWRPPRGE